MDSHITTPSSATCVTFRPSPLSRLTDCPYRTLVFQRCQGSKRTDRPSYVTTAGSLHRRSTLPYQQRFVQARFLTPPTAAPPWRQFQATNGPDPHCLARAAATHHQRHRQLHPDRSVGRPAGRSVNQSKPSPMRTCLPSLCDPPPVVSCVQRERTIIHQQPLARITHCPRENESRRTTRWIGSPSLEDTQS